MIHKLAAVFIIFTLTGATVNTQTHTQREAPKEVRNRLFKQALADSGERDCIEKEEGGIRTAEENMSVEEVDLNRDGVSEYEVELSSPCTCGMVNCSIFVYRQSLTGYELILDGAAGLGLELLKTSSNGYADVKIDARENAASQSSTVYKFDGTRYREARSTLTRMDTGETKPASRRVQFRRGSSSTTIQGKVSLVLPDTLIVGARAGQTMTVQLTAPSKSVKFMLMTYKTTQSLADNTRSWTGTLPETGDYIILIDGDERGSTYSMTISIK
jgi:hypothetical protein